jgi:hypothetical protein
MAMVYYNVKNVHASFSELTKWKTGVVLPDIGGTIHTQSAGQPPRARS